MKTLRTKASKLKVGDRFKLLDAEGIFRVQSRYRIWNPSVKAYGPKMTITLDKDTVVFKVRKEVKA